jgi:hypothetical protein
MKQQTFKPRNPMKTALMFREQGRHGSKVTNKQRRAKQKDFSLKCRELQ